MPFTEPNNNRESKDFSALLRERDEVMPFTEPNNNKGK